MIYYLFPIAVYEVEGCVYKEIVWYQQKEYNNKKSW